MAKLATKSEAESILKLQGAEKIYRRGINSLAGNFEDGLDAECAADFLKSKGYKAHALTDMATGGGVCVVGIRG